MRFKYWFYITEAISLDDKNNVLNSKLYQNEKDPTIKSKLDELLAKLESDPQNYTKADIFKQIQDIIPKIVNKKIAAVQEPEPTNPTLKEYWHKLKNNEIIKAEYEIAKFYQNEQSNTLQETMGFIRKLIHDKKININFVQNKPVLIHQEDVYKDPIDFNQFNSFVHAILSSESQVADYDDVFPNPVFLAAMHPDLLEKKGNNVWVFKVKNHKESKLFGRKKNRESGWCVTWNNPQHYLSYRKDNEQTQYYIFDFNKAKDDPARYVNPGVAPTQEDSEWVDARNRPNEGINGYGKNIKKYKDYLETKGIDPNIFKSEPLTEKEKILYEALDNFNFLTIFKSHPDLIDDYLSLCEALRIIDFDLLTNEQKNIFLTTGDIYIKMHYLVNKSIDENRDDCFNTALKTITKNLDQDDQKQWFERAISYAITKGSFKYLQELLQAKQQYLPSVQLNKYSIDTSIYFMFDYDLNTEQFTNIFNLLSAENLIDIFDIYNNAASNKNVNMLKKIEELKIFKDNYNALASKLLFWGVQMEEAGIGYTEMPRADIPKREILNHLYEKFSHHVQESPSDARRILKKLFVKAATANRLVTLLFILEKENDIITKETLNEAASGAIASGSYQAFEFLLANGANDYDKFLKEIFRHSNLVAFGMAELLIKKYSTYLSPQAINDAFVEAARQYNIEGMDFLVATGTEMNFFRILLSLIHRIPDEMIGKSFADTLNKIIHLGKTFRSEEIEDLLYSAISQGKTNFRDYFLSHLPYTSQNIQNVINSLEDRGSFNHKEESMFKLKIEKDRRESGM